jgi:hypothetical protein
MLDWVDQYSRWFESTKDVNVAKRRMSERHEPRDSLAYDADRRTSSTRDRRLL